MSARIHASHLPIRGRGLKDTISPAQVTTYDEEQARKIWQAGNAAFMRNWPYAYRLGADVSSAISGKFDVTVLPKGGDNGLTLRAWVAIS